VGPDTLHCHRTEGHGSQTFYEVIQNSCNVGFVQIAQRMGIENFYKYIELFGMTSPTGIDLPGESRGIIVPQESAKPIDLASNVLWANTASDAHANCHVLGCDSKRGATW